jgi:hypothetical protein
VIDNLYKALSPYFDGQFTTETATQADVCHCCERSISETIEPELKAFATVYSDVVTHCLPCQLLFEGNKPLLGAKVKGRVEYCVLSSEVNDVVQEIATSKELTRAEKVKQLKHHIKLLPASNYHQSLPTLPMYVAPKEKIYLKSEFSAFFLKKQRELSKLELLAWLNDNNALVSEGMHNDNLKSLKYRLLCINEGGEEQRRFGMLSGLGMVVSTDEIVLYAPGNHFQNLAAIEDFPFELVPFGGVAMINDVINRFGDSRPLLVIDSFGVKKKNLVQNLKISTQKNGLYICNDNEQVFVDVVAYQALLAFFKSTPKKTRLEIISIIRQLLQGQLSPVLAQEKLSDVDGIQSVMMSLPADPHVSLNLLRLVNQYYG